MDIPVIGIGSGNGCDGQVLVIHDILGLGDFIPKHAKVYANIGELTSAAIKNYIDNVVQGTFPTAKNSFIIEGEVYQQLMNDIHQV